MLTCKEQNVWLQFLDFIQKRITESEYKNWFSHIKVTNFSTEEITLEVPNIFVQQYLLDNYQKDMLLFLPTKKTGELNINFKIKEIDKTKKMKSPILPQNINSLDTS